MSDAPSNASFQRRLGAMFYDGLLLFALLMIAATPVVMIAGANSGFVKSPLYSLYLYGVSFVFFGWFWTRGGQTLGMRSWKVRVMRFDGRPVGWDSALMRYLLATISLGLFGLGFIWILFDRDNLAWHDQLSRTRIVFDPTYGNKQAD
ncbi:MAG: RDD family protein [Gammaproteobacteria bacterium]|nr:RDD family protein [Gammaproteobacteria bacterium]